LQIKSAVFIKSAVIPSDYPPSEYPEFAFVGRSNVGKSSLINCLAQRRALAKTSNTPGRTRLLNFFLINTTTALVDLPGYGFAKISVQARQEWGVMIESYLTKRPSLKAVVFVWDIRRDPGETDFFFLEWLEEKNLRIIMVVNKIDKLSGNQRLKRLAKLHSLWKAWNLEIIPFSSQTKEGREVLWQALLKRL